MPNIGGKGALWKDEQPRQCDWRAMEWVGWKSIFSNPTLHLLGCSERGH